MSSNFSIKLQFAHLFVVEIPFYFHVGMCKSKLSGLANLAFMLFSCKERKQCQYGYEFTMTVKLIY